MPANIAATVILVTGDGAEALSGILSRLRWQTIAGKLEIIIVSRSEKQEEIQALRPNEFADFRVLVHDLSTSARARAHAVRSARGDVVIMSEDHAFPVSDTWAERLVEHAQHATAVGPVVRNANPKTASSWATLFVEYGFWLGCTRAGPTKYVAGHNSAYRKEALLAFGDRLANMLEAEWVLHHEFRQMGHEIWIDPEIEVAHINYSRIRPSLKLHYVAGRMFATNRARDWTRSRSLGYAAAAPAIFAKRLAEITVRVLKSPAAGQLPRAFPLLSLYLALSAMGEAMGYAFGSGDLESEHAEMEYSRWQNVLPDEVSLQTRPME